MKNRLSVLWIFLVVMVIGFLFAGCENPAGGDRPTTISYTLGSDGFYQFYTNDPDKCGYGYRVVAPNPNANTNVYEVECKKMSGANNSGYGMIFGASDTNTEVFYCVNILTNGRYAIWERVPDGEGGYEWTDSPIQDWIYSTRLNTGYNVLNTIKVEKGINNYFIYFNDSLVNSFPYTVADEKEKGHGSRGGFYTSIGSAANENFPNTPVDVRFRVK